MPSPDAPGLADWTLLPTRVRSERTLLAILLLVAFLLRTAGGIACPVISSDGAVFTLRARMIGQARFGDALAQSPQMPPLYPICIHLAGLVFRDLFVAGVAISVLFGTLALLPLYFLVKGIAGSRVAAVTALLYAFMPQVALLSGEVMSESLFLFSFLSWMALLWSATREPHWVKFVLAGLAAGAAFLTRPEGIYAVAGTIGWCAITMRRAPLKILAGAACTLLLWLVLAYPYLLWVRSFTGHWRFTANPFACGILDRLAGKPPPEPRPEEASFIDPETEFKEVRASMRFGRVGGALFSVLRESVKVCFYIFLPLGLLGLVLARRRGFRGPGILFLVLFILGYGVPTIIGMLTGAPFGYRYIMPSCIFAMPFIAVGTMEILRLLARVRWLPVIASAAVLIAMTVKIVKPRRGDKLPLKEAGLWIKRQYGPGQRVAFQDRRIEHYAETQGVSIPTRIEFLPAGVRFVVLYTAHLYQLEPGFEEKLQARFVTIKEFKNVRIYAPR